MESCGKGCRIGHALLGLLVLSLLSACGKSQEPGGQPPPVAVDVVSIQSSPVTLTKTYAGRVTAFREAEIRPQVSGIVLKRAFEEGALVKEGDLLYQLDPAIHQAELARARGELALAEANLEQARLKAERYKALISTEAVSKQGLDEANAEWRQVQAQIMAARAEVDRAQVNLNYTRITAPISGVIGRSLVTEGALVSAQQAEPLATIYQLSPIFVDIRQPATDRLALADSPSLQVSLTLENGTPYDETGVLQFTEISVDPGTGTVTSRIRFDNARGLLMPGLFVRATLSIAQRDAGLLVPQAAVTLQPNGSASVMVVTDKNLVESRPVTISSTVGKHWLVESGLSEGDRVVVSGLQKIRPGMPVVAELQGVAEAAGTSQNGSDSAKTGS